MLSRILTSGASMLAAVGVAVAPTAAGQTVRSLGPGRVIVPTPSMDLGYVTPPMFPLADGGTLFLDSIDKRLLRAGGATRALQQIGSGGEGPGQFRHPSGLWTRNDSLVLTDQALRRASVFGVRDPSFVGSWSVGLATSFRGLAVRPIAAFSQSCWIGVSTRGSTRPRTERMIPTVDVIVLVTEAGTDIRVDSLLAVEMADFYVHPLGTIRGNRRRSVTGTFPRLALSPSGDAFAVVEVAAGAKPAISIQYVTDPCRTPARTVTVSVATRELSMREMREIYEKRLWVGDAIPGLPPMQERVDDAIEQTRRTNGRFIAPLFSDAFMDREGNVWVEVEGDREVADFGRPRRWTVVDPGGRVTAEYSTPADVRLQTAGYGRVLGWRTGEDGGSVVEFRLP